MTDRAKIMVKFLFSNYMKNKDKKINEFHHNFDQLDESDKARVIADYIAGMTDRFAISEYNRLVQQCESNFVKSVKYFWRKN